MNYRTFKYRLYPTKSQSIIIDNIIDNCRKLRDIFNNVYSDQDYVTKDGLMLLNKIRNEYPEFKGGYESPYLIQLYNCIDAKKKKIEFVNNAFKVPYNDEMQKLYPINEKKLYVHSIGWIKYKGGRDFKQNYRIRYYYINRKGYKYKKYYAYLCVSIGESENRQLDPKKIIAFDYSSTHFIVDNNNNKYDIPHFYRDELPKIKVLCQQITSKQKNSNNYLKAKLKLQNKYQMIVNRRTDYLHKLSTKIANEYDYVVIESLDMISIAKRYNLAKATYDNCYAFFISMLDYKMSTMGKKLIKADRWFPSSKKCNSCGHIIEDLDLRQRAWVCPKCNSELERDHNAALNLLEYGKNKIYRMAYDISNQY